MTTVQEKLNTQFNKSLFCAPVIKIDNSYKIGNIIFDINTLKSISLGLAVAHVNYLYSMSAGNCFKSIKQADEAIERFKNSELENSVLNLLAFLSKEPKINKNAKTAREKEINKIIEKYFNK